jgi:hypothetical protein
MLKNWIRYALSCSLVPATLALPAAAQGSDNCATPTVISGEGNFAFNNGSATTGAQGQSNAACNFFGTTGISNDVWFTWTAPSDGTAALSLCGGASFDSKIAAYSGAGCPAGAPLACNDDSCGLQSQILFSVAMGNTYTIQLGCFPGAAGGSGTFFLQVGGSQPGCGGGTGPDVIVGDVSDVLNAPSVGGIDAIALGTTSCNVGTALLNWIAGTNDHPVIRQNLYRYKIVGGAGRFEQVGMSWLKHGFASLQDSLCCTCQGGGDGSHLGVGCSDPYGAGLNGSQGGLGPNWQVNAHTGVFTYPPANPAHGTDTIYRRCQVGLVDIELTGLGNTTRYFGECHYVTKDDATAGNQNNNASWREITTSGGPSDYNFNLIGVTQRGQSAIHAWAGIDPAVKLSNLQVAGDGLIVLGTRATDIGGGLWRYEYAVYNMNADRNVGSFSVPIGAGVSLSNIGFHDVAYHDGDGSGNVNESGVDWTPTQAGGSITWACETQAQNANANAIRWGTTYNFRFDADAAPGDGPITVGLWKTGAPPSIVGIGDVPGASAGTSFCFGDGTGTACPCSNSGVAGHGCDNSVATGGAVITAAGVPSLSADTLHFTSTNELPTALSIVLQGSTTVSAVNFGDGLRCAGGTLLRMYSKNAIGGVVMAPQAGDPPVSIRSAALGDLIPMGATRVYQVYYRDPNMAFCPDPPGDTFNATNAVSVLWGS